VFDRAKELRIGRSGSERIGSWSYGIGREGKSSG